MTFLTVVLVLWVLALGMVAYAVVQWV